MVLTVLQRTDTAAQFVTVLIMFILILAVTVLTTRWIAGYQKQQNLNGNIEVIETQRIANGKYLQIVRVGEKYLAVAVCKDTVTLLAEVSKEQLVINQPGKAGGGGFSELFQNVKKIYSEKKQEPKEK